MTAAQQLQHWLSDRSAQRRTQRDIDAFGRAWNCGPVRKRFDTALAALRRPTAQAVAEAVGGLLTDDGWVDALIHGLTERLRADPFFDPPFRAINSDIHKGLIVLEHNWVSIAIGVAGAAELAAKKSSPRGATSVGFSGRLTLLKFVKAGGALLSFWEAPPITRAFSAADAGSCRRTGERRLADGEMLVVDGSRQGYVIEQAGANLLILQAEITCDQAPVAAEYDSASRRYVGCSANGDDASRIQMLSTLLRKLGGDEAFDAITPFLDHPDFFVRWHVMRELLGIDARAVMPALERMASQDPHPDVRRAAAAALGRMASEKRRAA